MPKPITPDLNFSTVLLTQKVKSTVCYALEVKDHGFCCVVDYDSKIGWKVSADVMQAHTWKTIKAVHDNGRDTRKQYRVVRITTSAAGLLVEASQWTSLSEQANEARRREGPPEVITLASLGITG